MTVDPCFGCKKRKRPTPDDLTSCKTTCPERLEWEAENRRIAEQRRSDNDRKNDFYMVIQGHRRRR